MYIKAEKLVKSYGSKKVVDEVSIDVKQGEVVGLLGPNGAGKTTSFYMVVGLAKPDSGHVYLEGNEITYMPMHKRAQMGLGYLPQEQSIFKKLTVEENIIMLWEATGKVKKEDYQPKLDTVLDELGVKHLRHNRCYQLSGGEARRVEIARALAMEPMFLLLDEPFTGIDPITVSELQKIIIYLKNKGLGILITDHNVRETLAIVDRAYIIQKGKILVSGNSSYIANDETAKKIYLGEEFKL
ncbi:MAG: LPS export ABC transporter ATP-binding protein [Candidatus Saganbacteria bacterium]|nr:LPS export ABC transporter ATP-binding protein [Candidatus Saganbacteria bacterium]